MSVAGRLRRAPALLLLVPLLAGLLSGAAAADPGSLGAGAPPGYTKVVGLPVDAPSGPFDSGAETACPAGTVAWGGGAALTGGIPFAGTTLNSSAPGGLGWRARFNNTSAGRVQFRVDVACAAPPPGYTLRFATADNPAGQLSRAVAACPTGTVLLSGGTLSTATTSDVALASAFPKGATFTSVVFNGSTQPQRLTSFAVCSARPARYARVSSTVTGTGPATLATAAQCPPGTSIVGGGAKVAGARPRLALGASLPEPATQWLAEVVDPVPGPVTITTSAICAGG